MDCKESPLSKIETMYVLECAWVMVVNGNEKLAEINESVSTARGNDPVLLMKATELT
jgi:hypothetical protein